MLDFLEVAEAVRVLYERITDKLTEDDFWLLTPEQYTKLPLEQRSKTWFMINPSKLKSEEREVWIVDEHEKSVMFRAVKLIEKYTEDLPPETLFLERLLNAKKMLPPVLFSRRKE